MKNRGFSDISVSDIRARISDTALIEKYLEVSVPEVINSPFRKDSRPSFSLFVTESGIVRYNDFATGEKGDVYNLLQRLWNTDIKGVCDRILSDSPDLVKNMSSRPVVTHKRTSSKLDIVIRKWKQYDLDYWEQYGISQEWLEFGDVYPISAILLDGVRIACDKLAYAYIERKDGIVTYKIYNPLSKEYKWLSRQNSSVWDLWTQLPERGDDLIITSSRKDALCIWSNTGVPSVSLQSEGCIPKLQVVNQLKSRFKRVYVLYDNDFQSEVNHGYLYGRQLAENFGLIQLQIPDIYKSKDTSDLCKNHGRIMVNRVINTMLKPYKNQ